MLFGGLQSAVIYDFLMHRVWVVEGAALARKCMNAYECKKNEDHKHFFKGCTHPQYTHTVVYIYYALREHREWDIM